MTPFIHVTFLLFPFSTLVVIEPSASRDHIHEQRDHLGFKVKGGSKSLGLGLAM